MDDLVLKAIRCLLENGFSPREIEILVKKKLQTRETKKMLETFRPMFRPGYEKAVIR